MSALCAISAVAELLMFYFAVVLCNFSTFLADAE